MWIVNIALRRPYTFIVMALLILLSTPLVLTKMATDIFPDINIPVISIIWNYSGLSAQEMGQRITGVTERSLTTTVNDIEHIESQTLNGIKCSCSQTLIFKPPRRRLWRFRKRNCVACPLGLRPRLSLNIRRRVFLLCNWVYRANQCLSRAWVITPLICYARN